MKDLLLATFQCAISSALPAQNLRVVDVASLSSVSVAPGSIVTIFSTKLTNGMLSPMTSGIRE